MEAYRQTKGRIFDIQKFSIHDGDGIRTIVFLKGCVLRCRWCCNPESQEYAIQTMKVSGEPKIIGRDVTVDEVMEIVEQDRPYYYRSGGGLTLSGGESLCQPEFSRDLLRGAKERGINTAMESMACAKYEVIESILPYLDHYLLDIKHMNPAKHKEFTGKSNELMLENAKKIACSGQVRLSIRIPVIPTFNDSEEEIRAIARYAKELDEEACRIGGHRAGTSCSGMEKYETGSYGIEKIHLLPYHRLGQDKYDGLDRKYLMKEILPPGAEQMEGLKRAAEQESGLACQIGG
ncbi:MAG: radical SAM protein [Lachnospiraceae bacterium]|jgi:pyruvate formate lyase activating enzyme|nr:radical SAM protein [Lachnospiraceae bacterium]MCI9109566.1 radical SAM protein [Lachnospiraceae bacterium]